MSQLTEFAGQAIRALPDDFPPGVMQYWISNPHALREALRGALAPIFPTWRTVTLGTHKSVPALQEALEEADCGVSSWAYAVIAKPTFKVADEGVVKLVKISVAELGFSEKAGLVNIYERAVEFGLGLNPPEVGPALRLDYLDQPRGERLVVASEVVTGLDYHRGLFVVANTRVGPWLDTYHRSPYSPWSIESTFLFQYK